MSIASRTPICSKLVQFIRPHFHTSFLHSDSEISSIAEPVYQPSTISQIVEILKSGENETWESNPLLSDFLISRSISHDDILHITRRLETSSIALNFVQHLRSNIASPDANLLSLSFQAVFELASRKPTSEEKLLDLFKTSKEMGIALTVNSANLLIRIFGRLGLFEKSVMVYDELDSQLRNTHIRNVMIAEFFRHGRFDDALKVLDEMLQPNSEFPPNLNTVALVFPVLLKGWKHGRGVSKEEVVEFVLKFGSHRVFPDSVMLTRWITELCRNRKLDMACMIVHALMEFDGAVGVAPFNALLTGLSKGRQFSKMQELLEEMMGKGISPNVVTFGIIINHLCKSSKIDEALKLFDDMRQGKIGDVIVPDVIMYNTLIDGLCKAGRAEEGLAMMRKMVLEGNCSPSNVTYNCLIDGFCKAGELDMSLELFDEMEKQGVQPNVVTVNSLVGGMCRDGKAGNALKFYRDMAKKGLKGNKVTYTILTSGFCGINNINKALEMLKEMKQTCTPDAIVYYSLISGLSQAGLMEDVETFLSEMKSDGFRPDIACYNVMISGFCKKNKLDKAHWLLEEMQMVGLKPDGITFNTLISYFSKTGDLKTALKLLTKMVGDNVIPTVYTYGALIHGCCSVGELDEAMKIFRQMSSSSKIPPNTVIYNVLIDAMCQKNKMTEALSLSEDMIAKGVTPDSNTFNALFKGLRDENELEKALELMERMTELACPPDYITMEVLTEWLSAVGEADKLRQFVQGFR